jgi:hypothetical protein
MRWRRWKPMKVRTFISSPTNGALPSPPRYAPVRYAFPRGGYRGYKRAITVETLGQIPDQLAKIPGPKTILWITTGVPNSVIRRVRFILCSTMQSMPFMGLGLWITEMKFSARSIGLSYRRSGFS